MGPDLLFDLLLLGYATGVGFAIAGIVATSYQLVTNRPARFPVPSLTSSALFMGLAASALIGPFVVMRGAFRSWLERRQPAGWAVAGVAVAMLWAACSGVLLLDLAVAVGHSLG